MMLRNITRTLHTHTKNLQQEFKVLGLEYTFDDSCAAIVTSSGRVLSHSKLSSWSQLVVIDGGIPPISACEEQTKNLPRVVAKALEQSNLTMEDIDVIAGPVGPGLGPCLDVGLSFSQSLSLKHNIPFVPVNHLESHTIVSRLRHKKYDFSISNSSTSETRFNFTPEKAPILTFPYLSLLVTGGNCSLSLISSPSDFQVLGKSLDDAPGEAIDKVARMLNLDTAAFGSGGAAVEKHALAGVARIPTINILRRDLNCNMSFSGVKSHYFRIIQQMMKTSPLDSQDVADICSSLQYSILKHLCDKTSRAVIYLLTQRQDLFDFSHPQSGGKFKHLPVPTQPIPLVLVGGVASNQFLVQKFSKYVQMLSPLLSSQLVVPFREDCSDGAVMIAWNAIEKLNSGLDLLSEGEIQGLTYFAKYPMGIFVGDQISKLKISLPRELRSLTAAL